MKADIQGLPSVYGTPGLGDFIYSGSGDTTGVDPTLMNQVENTGNISYGGGISNNTIASSVASLSSAFANIFKTIQPLPEGCTQVAGPYGVSTSCAGSGASNALSLSTLSSGGSSSLLLYGGLALIVFMMLKK